MLNNKTRSTSTVYSYEVGNGRQCQTTKKNNMISRHVTCPCVNKQNGAGVGLPCYSPRCYTCHLALSFYQVSVLCEYKKPCLIPV